MKRMPPISIHHLELFITERCNLACSYCFAGSMEGKVMEHACAIRSIRFAADSCPEDSILRISFWGGEPMTQIDLIKDLVAYSNDYCAHKNITVKFSIPTNTTLLTEENLIYIKNSGIQLSLSIDGTESSQMLRKTTDGKSSFPCVFDNIQRVRTVLHDRMPPIRKTVHPATVKYLFEDIQFFINHGFTAISFSPAIDPPWKEGDLETFHKEQEKIVLLWIQCLDTPQQFHITSWDESMGIRELYRRGQLRRNGTFFCGAGGHQLAVDISGNLYPCHRFVFYDKNINKYHLGSVLTGISENYDMFHRTAVTCGILDHRTDDCPECQYNNRCIMLCPAVNSATTGDLYGNDPVYCSFFDSTEQIIDIIEAYTGKKRHFEQYKEHAFSRIRNRLYSGFSQHPHPSVLWKDSTPDTLTERAFTLLNQLNTNEKS